MKEQFSTNAFFSHAIMLILTLVITLVINIWFRVVDE